MHFRFASPVAIARRHGLPEDEVRELVSAFPDEWGELLSEHRPGLGGAVAAGDILTTLDGKHVSRVADTPNGRPFVEESLDWQGSTEALVPSAAPPSADSARRLLHTRRRALPEVDEEKIAALRQDPLAPDARRQSEAEHLQLEALTPPGLPPGLGADTQNLAYVRPATVRMPRLMALGSATTAGLDNLAAAAEWQPFRTIDAREAGAHFYPWLARMRPATQRAVVNRWITHTQAWWLPTKACDLYLRRLHSGFQRGPERKKGGWEFCARCRQGRGGLAHCGPEQHETVRHACESCPEPGGAAEIMRVVTDCWEEVTGERLKPGGPTALFGDRRHGRLEEDAAMHKHLHVPWQALHAATVLAVHEAQRRAGPHGDAKRPLEEGRQPKVWTTARIMRKVRREFDKIAQDLWDDAKARHHSADFQKIWIQSGIAKLVRGRVRTRVLDDWQREDERGSAAQQQIHALCFATDGSARKEKPGQAGWGYTACLLDGTPAEVLDAAASTTSAAQPLYEESGRVVTNEKVPEFLGASKGKARTNPVRRQLRVGVSTSLAALRVNRVVGRAYFE